MGTIKLLLGIFAIVVAIYLCVELAPPYFAEYEFQDAIKNEATLSTYSTKSEDAIRDTIYKKAQDLDIPITPDQIKVQRIGPQATGTVAIETNYVVHLDMPLYPVDLHFDPSTTNKGAF
jgi:hypothetical protein